MLHDQEPTEEYRASVNDDAPDPDPVPLDEDSMLPEEYAEAQAQRAARKKLIEFQKAQIKHWLSYQYMKDHDLDPKDSGLHNPYHTLFYKLTGRAVNRPRRKPAINVWRRAHNQEIEDATKVEVLKRGAKKSEVASLREKAARKLYDKLSSEEQMTFEQQARDEYDVDLARWKEDMDGPLSQSPESRQQYVHTGSHTFMQPILDMASEAMGQWKCMFIAGGPEPAHRGRLNVLSVHAGTTTGDIKMNFGHAERVRYKEEILPIFGHFLKMCYSAEECRSRALKPEEGYTPVDAGALEEGGAGLHTLDDSLIRESQAPIVNSFMGQLVAPGPSPILVQPPPVQPVNMGMPPASIVPVGIAATTSHFLGNSATTGVELPAAITNPHNQPYIETSTSSNPSQLASPANSCPPSPVYTPPPSPAAAQESTIPDSTLQTSATEAGDTETVDSGTKTRKRKHAGAGANPSSRKRTRGMSELTSAPRDPSATPANNLDPTRLPPRATRQKHVAPSLAAACATAPVLIPADAPEWLRNSWVTFEEKEKYLGRGTLKADHCSACVGNWIGRRHSPVWRPKLGSLSKFEKSYMKWWAGLQPEWHLTADGKVKHGAVDGNWDVLQKPGINGLQSIVVALFFWGLDTKKKFSDAENWAEAVEDFIVACAGLLTM
ncbi:hypothetical protein CPC08DRAFT_767853 [Agrocybe pediades]|nr:hypothetical protein CPC08DRAFT_767853 [Agrocybe pediades]